MASVVSGTPLEIGEEAVHESQSIHLIPSNARQECVATALPICLSLGLRSSLLGEILCPPSN